MHLVSVLAMDHVVGFELATAGQVFGSARSLDDQDTALYSVRVCGPGRSVQVSAAGADLYTMTPPYGLAELLEADTIIVPAHESAAPVPPEIVRALRQANAQGRRIASICTGAGILAEAGLLDDRDATTHWRHAADLSVRFPRVRFDTAALYIDSGNVLTGAGVAAGVDLCLHMIRSDHGAAVAAQTARRLVMSPYRSGGQTQFIASDRAVTDQGSLAAIMRWMTANLHRPLTLAQVSRQARLSTRTLNRHFHDQTGSTPMQWLLSRRLQRAQELLESTTLSVEEVAHRSGFGSAAALRQHFRHHLTTTPTDYRRRFAATAARTPGQ